MSANEQVSKTNTLRVCQDIKNRFYSERIKVGDVSPEEPRRLSKVSLIAHNAELIIQNNKTFSVWPRDFNKADSDWAKIDIGALSPISTPS